jgi:hypothetical protein
LAEAFIYTLNKVVCDIGAGHFPAFMPTLSRFAMANHFIVGIHQFRLRSFSVNPAFAYSAGQQHSIVTLPPLPGDFFAMYGRG